VKGGSLLVRAFFRGTEPVTAEVVVEIVEVMNNQSLEDRMTTMRLVGRDVNDPACSPAYGARMYEFSKLAVKDPGYRSMLYPIVAELQATFKGGPS
jgi:hypothetical protein